LINASHVFRKNGRNFLLRFFMAVVTLPKGHLFDKKTEK